ncbi:ATP-grasp domain-containing protein [Candidatus Pelagibacter sp.]|jgi:predicted ATP-grasp superfamily ATP-dependent carboligase|nr:ATP-grasp domain-containing protein [Candidatus Pelagibacter sp.]
MNILLTGAGGIYVKYLIKKLNRKDLFNKVTIVDCDFKLLKKIKADYKYKVPPGSSTAFLPKILKIIDKRKIGVVVSVVDEELIKFLNIKKKLFLLQPNINFSKLCLNKYNLGRKLFKNKINKFQTFSLIEYKNNFNYPIVIKPIVGRGSRNVSVVKNFKQFQRITKKIRNKEKYIVQKIISGSEYTVSVLVNEKSSDYQIIPKKIIKKKRFTRKAVTEENILIKKSCVNLIKKFKPGGPFNVQCISSKKEVEIFEINPRLSTSSTLTDAAGVNEINILVKNKFFKNLSLKNIIWNKGVKLIRTNKDSFFYETKYK